jgi:hypothetical protein
MGFCPCADFISCGGGWFPTTIRAFVPDANLSDGDGESLHPSSAKFKNTWNYTYISLYALCEKNFGFNLKV